MSHKFMSQTFYKFCSVISYSLRFNRNVVKYVIDNIYTRTFIFKYFILFKWQWTDYTNKQTS